MRFKYLIIIFSIIFFSCNINKYELKAIRDHFSSMNGVSVKYISLIDHNAFVGIDIDKDRFLEIRIYSPDIFIIFPNKFNYSNLNSLIIMDRLYISEMGKPSILKGWLSNKELEAITKMKLSTVDHYIYNYDFILNAIKENYELVKQKKDEYLRNPNYRIIFTTNLNSEELPDNDLNEIPMIKDKFYVYTDWYNLPDSTFNYICKIFYSAGKKVSESSWNLTPKNNQRSVWTWYKFNKNIDSPGNWKIEIYLDKTKVIEKNILVVN